MVVLPVSLCFINFSRFKFAKKDLNLDEDFQSFALPLSYLSLLGNRTSTNRFEIITLSVELQVQSRETRFELVPTVWRPLIYL